MSSGAIGLFPDMPETEEGIINKIAQLEADAICLREEMARRNNNKRFGTTLRYVQDLAEYLKSDGKGPEIFAWYHIQDKAALRTQIASLQSEIRLLGGYQESEPFRAVGEKKQKLGCEEALSAAKHLLDYWSELLKRD